MRTPALIIGILLLIAGGLVSAGLFSFSDTKEVLKVGDASLSVTQQKTPDRTLGYVLLAVGAVVTVVGAMAKKR
jgi:hypothetical protein